MSDDSHNHLFYSKLEILKLYNIHYYVRIQWDISLIYIKRSTVKINNYFKMDKLFNKIKNNIKGKSKSKEEDQYKQQIDNEIKKRDKAVVGSAPPK